MTYYPDRLSKYSRPYLVVIHLAAILVLAAALALGLGWVVMRLWNAVLPSILPAHPITYWQSVGLLVLTRILFGGFGHGKHKNLKDYRHGEAWRKYDEWWSESGEQSFNDFSRPNEE